MEFHAEASSVDRMLAVLQGQPTEQSELNSEWRSELRQSMIPSGGQRQCKSVRNDEVREEFERERALVERAAAEEAAVEEARRRLRQAMRQGMGEELEARGISLCSDCLQAKPVMACLPCGHRCLCVGCSE